MLFIAQNGPRGVGVKVLLAVVLVTGSAWGQEPAKEGSVAAAIDAYLKPLVDAGHFSGCVLVTQQGKVVYEKAFGMANVEHAIPNSPQTRFCIASITKGMTRIVGIRLLEQRRLGLQDPLNKWVPGFPEGDKITVEHLMRHRAGIPHRVTTPQEETAGYLAADVAEKAKGAKLVSTPGERHVYSSGGYSVLAYVLERASGKPFGELLQEHVYQPAGLTATVDYDHAVPIPHRAQEFMLSANGPVRAPLKDYSFLVGAGSLFSTVGDVHRYCDAVLDGKFGEGARLSLSQDGVMFTNGSTNGFRAFAAFDRKKSYGLVVASNLASGANDLLQRDLPLILQGQHPPTPSAPRPHVVATPPERLADYLGHYRFDRSEFDVTIRRGQLYAGDYHLTPVGPDKFYAFGNYGDVTFRRDEKGTVKEIGWTIPLGDSTWVKEPPPGQK